MTDEEKEQCDRPKTRGEVALEIVKLFLKFLDENKVESCIFFAGVASALNIGVMGKNLEENIRIIISFFN